ncbi:MAG: Fic family protein [Fusobacteriaceae bacterium]
MKKLKYLPPIVDIETKEILKQVNKSNRKLAELKGMSKTIPNSLILINTLALREAKDSSEIENIITTNDNLYKADIEIEITDSSTKEVQNYTRALKKGFNLIKSKGFLTTNLMIEIQEELEKNKSGIRRQPGTILKNPLTGETVYTPPQDYDEILSFLKNLEEYINIDDDEIDPLIKLAIIHYQFESIHPFPDGNGRTGRIINILYLVLKELLDIPVLYLSSYIIKNKNDYYKLLNRVGTEETWEEWIMYMLIGIEKTAEESIALISGIGKIMDETRTLIQNEAPKIYSKDLVETLFLHPYTKIDFLVENLGLSRQTASSYLNQIEELNILKKEKVGKYNYYINLKLFQLLS